MQNYFIHGRSIIALLCFINTKMLNQGGFYLSYGIFLKMFFPARPCGTGEIEMPA